MNEKQQQVVEEYLNEVREKFPELNDELLREVTWTWLFTTALTLESFEKLTRFGMELQKKIDNAI